MRFDVAIPYDIWTQGGAILLVIDTRNIPGLVVEYIGKQDINTLKRKFHFGKPNWIVISHDCEYFTLVEEFPVGYYA